MAFCAKCGTPLAEAVSFCRECGTPVSAAGGSSPAPPQGSGVPTALSGLAPNVAGALAYITIIPAILFLAVEPYNRDKFIRFHAFQSIFLAAAWFIFWIVWGEFFLGMFFGTFGALWRLLALVGHLVSLAFLLCLILCAYKAYNSDKFMLPIIGPLAAKQAG